MNEAVARALIRRFTRADIAALQGDVTTLQSQVYTQSATAATTSGGGVNISGIPTTALEIKVHLLGVSLSGTDDLLVQFLDSGGAAITAGYNSSGHGLVGTAVGSSTSTAGFVLRVGAAANTVFLTLTLNRVSGSTTWIGAHVGNRNTAGMVGGGSIAVGGDVTGVRLTRTGADTLDAGSFYAEWRS